MSSPVFVAESIARQWLEMFQEEGGVIEWTGTFTDEPLFDEVGDYEVVNVTEWHVRSGSGEYGVLSYIEEVNGEWSDVEYMPLEFPSE